MNYVKCYQCAKRQRSQCACWDLVMVSAFVAVRISFFHEPLWSTCAKFYGATNDGTNKFIRNQKCYASSFCLIFNNYGDVWKKWHPRHYENKCQFDVLLRGCNENLGHSMQFITKSSHYYKSFANANNCILNHHSDRWNGWTTQSSRAKAVKYIRKGQRWKRRESSIFRVDLSLVSLFCSIRDLDLN